MRSGSLALALGLALASPARAEDPALIERLDAAPEMVHGLDDGRLGKADAAGLQPQPCRLFMDAGV